MSLTRFGNLVSKWNDDANFLVFHAKEKPTIFHVTDDADDETFEKTVTPPKGVRIYIDCDQY